MYWCTEKYVFSNPITKENKHVGDGHEKDFFLSSKWTQKEFIFHLDRNVHPSTAWILFCSCIRSCRWCSCKSVHSHRCDAHTHRYLWATGDIMTWRHLSKKHLIRKLSPVQQEYRAHLIAEECFCPTIWPLHVFPSGCSVKPTGQLQRTPVDVSLQVQSHPPLFTAQVSEITTSKMNVWERPTC